MVVKEDSKLIPILLIYHSIFNLSLSKSHVPSCLKHSIITPVLKKSNLNTNEYKSFRPVSNLSFVSKLIEKCVYLQIQSYLEYNHLFCQFQSAYRIGRSCETALICIHNDLLFVVTALTVNSINLIYISSVQFSFSFISAPPHEQNNKMLKSLCVVKDGVRKRKKQQNELTLCLAN